MCAVVGERAMAQPPTSELRRCVDEYLLLRRRVLARLAITVPGEERGGVGGSGEMRDLAAVAQDRSAEASGRVRVQRARR